MDPIFRTKIIRMVALRLLYQEVPNAPAGAVGPPSIYWETAEAIVDNVAPYFREYFKGQVDGLQ